MLDHEGLEPLSLIVREPTLDDVFLSLTGHAAEDEDEDETDDAETPKRGRSRGAA
jgi:ABC-2 type transport system ATP-binding protein